MHCILLQLATLLWMTWQQDIRKFLEYKDDILFLLVYHAEALCSPKKRILYEQQTCGIHGHNKQSSNKNSLLKIYLDFFLLVEYSVTSKNVLPRLPRLFVFKLVRFPSIFVPNSNIL
jgi:hypothetical protein